jgi:hypothetical protein
MSIVAMKRKSRRFKATISGQNDKGFSLNGGYRNQGWVGQGVRGRSLTGTRFRGDTAMGNGGCCGQYKVNVTNSGSCCTNDPSIVKRSTMNTAGLLDATVVHPTSVFNPSCEGGCPDIMPWVKNFSPLDHSQGSHIDKLARKSGTCTVAKHDAGKESCQVGCKSASYHIGGKKYVRTMYSKGAWFPVAPSEYQRTVLMSKLGLPTPPEKAPFPMALSHNRGTCQINFLTPSEAQARGLLIPSWMLHAVCGRAARPHRTTTVSQDVPVQTGLENYSNVDKKFLDGQQLGFCSAPGHGTTGGCNCLVKPGDVRTPAGYDGPLMANCGSNCSGCSDYTTGACWCACLCHCGADNNGHHWAGYSNPCDIPTCDYKTDFNKGGDCYRPN